MELGASAEDIARTCHAHPILPEAVKEAALAVTFAWARGSRRHPRCSACGANKPSAMKTTPTAATPLATQASHNVAVTTAAAHMTMPIWNAAEATS
jgi:hypothetical protein